MIMKYKTITSNSNINFNRTSTLIQYHVCTMYYIKMTTSAKVILTTFAKRNYESLQLIIQNVLLQIGTQLS